MRKVLTIIALFAITSSGAMADKIVNVDQSAGGGGGPSNITTTNNASLDNYSNSSSYVSSNNTNNNANNSASYSSNYSPSSSNSTSNAGGGSSTANQSMSSVDRSTNFNAPAAVAPSMISVPGSQSVSGGFSTPFGGISFGKSTTIPEARHLLVAQEEITYRRAEGVVIDNLIKLDGCTSQPCQLLREHYIRIFEAGLE